MGAGTASLRPLLHAATAWLTACADVLLPDRCTACGAAVARPERLPLAVPAGWCVACAARVVPLDGARCLDCGAASSCQVAAHLRMHAAVQYGDEVAALVRAAKYRGAPAVAGAWLRVWASALEGRGATPPRPHLLAPVPLHPARARERGWDVPAEWARLLGGLHGVPTARLLRRRRATPPQVGRDRAGRAANVAGAFAAGDEASAAAGRAVALVDDVVTTGATAREAARAVRALGAARVEVWCLAYEPLE